MNISNEIDACLKSATTRSARVIEHPEVERLRAAIVWALGAGEDVFRPQGTMEGKYWWRGELAMRAGLDWDGEKYIPTTRHNAPLIGGDSPPNRADGYRVGNNLGEQ